MYKANYYLNVMEFRQQTLERLQKFVDRRFFVTKDYIDSEPAAARSTALLCALCPASVTASMLHAAVAAPAAVPDCSCDAIFGWLQSCNIDSRHVAALAVTEPASTT